MDNSTDYYTLLGVTADAAPAAIKAAFKKRALQYHPDIYKGADAQERMRIILQAYHTLSDPVARRQYDSLRAEQHLTSAASSAGSRSTAGVRPAAKGAGAEVSPRARRDRQRHYAFPSFTAGRSVYVDLDEIEYTLAPAQAQELLEQGMLRGVLPETQEHVYFCHRCHHRWPIVPAAGVQQLPRTCPKCQATDWSEYLLLRCIHCSAVFESEQIRYAVGSYTYGKEHAGELCPPYELFPLCPYCGTAHWSPAEDRRVDALRARAARQMNSIRLMLIAAITLAVVFLAAVVLGLLR